MPTILSASSNILFLKEIMINYDALAYPALPCSPCLQTPSLIYLPTIATFL